MIVDIAGHALKSEDLSPTQTVPAEWILSGTAEEASHLVHASPDGKFIVQVWEGRTAAEVALQGYPVDEFITLISGSVTLCEDGTDDLDALATIAPPLRQAIFSVVDRENAERTAKADLQQLTARICKLEAALG